MDGEVFIFSKELNQRYPVSTVAKTLGSQADRADWVLQDRSVSRLHAEVRWDKSRGRVAVRDLQSSNGTFTATGRVTEAYLGNGESFRCGRVGFVVELPKLMKTDGDGRSADRNGKPVIRTGRVDFQATRLEPRIPAAVAAFKKEITEALRQRLDRSRAVEEVSAEQTTSRVTKVVSDFLKEFRPPVGVDVAVVQKSLIDDLLGYGPLQAYLDDEDVTEIMVNREDMICIERRGRIDVAGDVFTDRNQLMNVIERIVNRVNRKVNESSPLVDARLPDGSRVNVIIPPLALDGPCMTIRKFRKEGFSIEDLVRYGSLSADMADFLRICVECRLNILISGGTGSGKTTLLNVISSFIPESERIVTIEDSAELRLPQFHVVRLETRPENIEGKGRIAIRDLVINALRMRPDRIVVGECRGGEALDMVQAMNTGHDGSLTTAHANSPRDALRRLEVMCLMAGVDLPLRAIREQLASAIHVVVQIARFSDGSRKVTQISEVTGMQQDIVSMQDLFKFHDRGVNEENRRVGEHQATGTVSVWADAFAEKGMKIDLSIFRKPGPETGGKA